MTKNVIRFAILIAMCAAPGVSQASGWSWNIGYHNPPTSNVGLNFMHSWTNFAFELGVGSIESKQNNTVTTGGDLNLKYLFGTGWLRPYIQGGYLMGSAVNSNGASSSTGQNFLGAGLFLKGNPFYFYIGGNSLNHQTEVSLGLGFDF